MIKTDVRAGSLEALRDRLSAFEAVYGVLSADMLTAFTNADGVVEETPALRTWSRLYRNYSVLARAREAHSV